MERIIRMKKISHVIGIVFVLMSLSVILSAKTAAADDHEHSWIGLDLKIETISDTQHRITEELECAECQERYTSIWTENHSWTAGEKTYEFLLDTEYEVSTNRYCSMCGYHEVVEKSTKNGSVLKHPILI